MCEFCEQKFNEYNLAFEVKELSERKESNGYTRTFTKRNWWEMLGMASHKYGRTPENKLKNLDYRITSWEVRHFYQRCNKKLEQILFSALNSLKNRKLITYEIQTVIVTKDKEVYEKMQSIQEVANQLGEDKYANRLSDQINDAQELTDKYKDMYDAYVRPY